jgi:hypoxanthine phosphoribosyltransferase
MKHKLVLDSGKELELTEKELQELKDSIIKEKQIQFIPYPAYPVYPSTPYPVYPSPWWSIEPYTYPYFHHDTTAHKAYELDYGTVTYSSNTVGFSN